MAWSLIKLNNSNNHKIKSFQIVVRPKKASNRILDSDSDDDDEEAEAGNKVRDAVISSSDEEDDHWVSPRSNIDVFGPSNSCHYIHLYQIASQS